MDVIRSSSAFAPKTNYGRGKKQTVAPSAFSSKTTFFALPRNATQEHSTALGLYLLICSTSESAVLAEWKVWLATMVATVSPSFQDDMTTKGFNKVSIPETDINQLCTLIENVNRSLDDSDEALLRDSFAAIRAWRRGSGLPLAKEGLDCSDSYGEWIPRVILFHYSIVLFLAGKQPNGNDHSQFTQKRPLAIRSKFHVDDPLSFLEGNLRMSDEAHTRINQAWSELSALRRIAIEEYAKHQDVTGDEFSEIIWTTMHLLQWSHMAHAAITYDFLRTYDWAVEVPALKSSIAVYLMSLENIQKVNPIILPYLKLIWGDKSNVFPRKEMEPLIACATSVGKDTSATLADFYSSTQFTPIVAAFREEMDRRERIRLGRQAKEQKEVSDFLGIKGEEELDEALGEEEEEHLVDL